MQVECNTCGKLIEVTPEADEDCVIAYFCSKCSQEERRRDKQIKQIPNP